MNTELEQEIKDRTAQLPPEVKRAIASIGLAQKIATLGRKYALMIDQVGMLDTEISMAMLGLIKPDKLDEAFVNEIGLERGKAAALVDDINKEIFGPIRDALIGIGKHASNAAQPLERGNVALDLDKDEVLSGIENPTRTTPSISAPMKPSVGEPAQPAKLTIPSGAPVAAATFGSSFTTQKLSGTFLAAGQAQAPLAAPKITLNVGADKQWPAAAPTPAPSAPSVTPLLQAAPVVAATFKPSAAVPSEPPAPTIKMSAPVVEPLAPAHSGLVPPSLADAIRTAAPSVPLGREPLPTTPPAMPAAPAMSQKAPSMPGLSSDWKEEVALKAAPVAPVLKPATSLADAVRAAAPSIPLGREPIPSQPAMQPATPPAAPARVVNPLAGIPPEPQPSQAQAMPKPTAPTAPKIDPYREAF
jgi:hypothetical protein